MLLELLDGAPAGTLDAVLSSATAFAEWLYLPAEVRSLGCSHAHLCAYAVGIQAADAEALLLAVKLVDRLSPSATVRCSLLPRARPAALFTKQHLESLLPALLSSTAAHPRVHSVWGALVERLSSEEPAATEVFWEVACENSLFNSSHERKCVFALVCFHMLRTHPAFGRCYRFLGFKLFSMLLPTVHGRDVAVLFSPNFMRCLVNSLTNQETLLHSSASLCLSNVRAALLRKW